MNEEIRYRLVDQSCVDEVMGCFCDPEETAKFLGEVRDFGLFVHKINTTALFSIASGRSDEAVLGIVFGFLDIVYSNIDMVQDMVKKLKFVECSKEEVQKLTGIPLKDILNLDMNRYSRILNYLEKMVFEKEQDEKEEEEDEDEDE